MFLLELKQSAVLAVPIPYFRSLFVSVTSMCYTEHCRFRFTQFRDVRYIFKFDINHKVHIIRISASINKRTQYDIKHA
jgi:hypothetical protein